MYAIVETGGKQYRVEEGDTIRVELLEGEANAEIQLNNVLLLVADEKISIGKPYLEGVSISTLKIGDAKDPKKIVYKFKRRKDFHKKKGHRQKVSLLKVQKINA